MMPKIYLRSCSLGLLLVAALLMATMPASSTPLAPLCDASTTVSASFNSTPISAGRTVWFVNRIKVSGLGSQTTTIFVRQASVTFSANGVPYTIGIPDTRIIFDPAASQTTTSLDSSIQQWTTRVSPANFSRNVFAGGGAFSAPATGLPGSINPVSWTATLTADQPGVTLTWNWAAAVYTSFSDNYNALGVKPVDGNQQNPYNNNDQAGTPENYKNSVTAGATGNGGSNYTGSWTGNQSVTPCRLYQVGDLVWLDADADGIQEAGESGLDSVQINLFDDSGILRETTFSLTGGAFSLLATPGDYYLEFIAPDGYGFSPPQVGDDAALDSDPDPDSGQTPIFTLGAANDLTLDAGLFVAATLGDRVWYDTNQNGVQDSGEAGAPGASIFLYDSEQSLVDVQTTDEDGFYRFERLSAGSYTIVFEQPDGYFFTVPGQGGNSENDSDADPETGASSIIVLAAGANNETYDAGLLRAVALGDLIWYDANQNGVQSIGEPGVPNVPLDLYRDANGNGVLDIGSDPWTASRVTSADGSFLFSGLSPATYFVDAGALPGAFAGASLVSGPQSQPDPSGPLVVAYGLVLRGADFGVVKQPQNGQGLVGDSAWYDGNGDGRQQHAEPGIANLQVCATPTAGGAAVCTATDENGHFLLSLAPGAYTLAAPNPPAGLIAVGGSGAPFDVTVGAQRLDHDLGFADPAEAALGQIGNLIFADANMNGAFDAGETALAGVSVDLIHDLNDNDAWDPGEPIIAVTTSDSALDVNGGNYRFSGIPTGRYLVHVSDTNGVLLDFDLGPLGQPDTDDNSQSDPYVVVLAPGESSLLADFGYVRRVQPDTGLIGNQIWLDGDGDGLFAPGSGDAGVAGVTVELLQNSVVVRTTTSGAGGVYAFSGLAAGDYQVRVSDVWGVLVGMIPTAPGPQPGADHNNQAQPFSVALAEGETEPAADFGYRLAGVSVGGFAWLDSNGNGVYDTGEQMMNNVSLRITDSSSALMGDVITGPAGGFASGTYSLGGLDAGQYTVAFMAGPPGYTLIGPASLTTAYLALGQSDFGLNFPFINPTAVQVIDFGAWRLSDGRIELAWRTLGNVALTFDVWRAPTSAGEFTRVTPQPISGQPDGNGHFYGWSDTTALPGADGWYQLREAVTGVLIGPVPLTPLTQRFFLPRVEHTVRSDTD